MADGSGSARQWYVALKGKKHGPVTEDKLAEYLRSGKLKGSCMVWSKGFESWAKAEDTDLSRYLTDAPAGTQATVMNPETPPAQASPQQQAKPAETPTDSGPGWYVMVNEERVGPVDEPTLGGLLQSEQLSPKTLAWTKGMAEWQPAWKTELVKYIGRDTSSAPGPKSGAPNLDADDDDDFGTLKGGPEAEAAAANTGLINLLFTIAVFGWLLTGSLSLLALSGRSAIIAVLIIVSNLLSAVMAALMGSILLYRAWHVIQDNDVPIKPQTALGFLFIPFFNFYWVFRAHNALAGYMNLYLAQRHIHHRFINNKMALVLCITFISTAMAPLFILVPGIGRFIHFASLLVFCFVTVLTYQSFTKATQGILLYKGDPPDLPSNKFPMAMSLGIVGGVCVLLIVSLTFGIIGGGMVAQRYSDGMYDTMNQWDAVPTPYSDLPIDPFDPNSGAQFEMNMALQAAQSGMDMSYARTIAEGRPFSCRASMDDLHFNNLSSNIEISVRSRGMDDAYDGCTIIVSIRGTNQSLSTPWVP